MDITAKIRAAIVQLQEIEAELTTGEHPDMLPDKTIPYEKVFKNARVARVVEYVDGWVPNSHKTETAIGTCRVYERDGTRREDTYDRHRLRGQGPHWRAYSQRGKLIAEG